jgi:hypothetical protein
MAYTQCTILKHKVEFKLIPTSGYISVGIDGWLVGNYENDAEAIVAALEHVRVVEGRFARPMLPGRVRKELREMTAAVVARHEERPVEGSGWYVYVGGQDAGGPFETEADALEAWQS